MMDETIKILEQQRKKLTNEERCRYLRCRICRMEFSERKNRALWNTKLPEAKAVSVGDHLVEGCSLKGTARLVKVDPSTVSRQNQRLGEHGEAFHDGRVQDIEVEALEADERHGYANNKGELGWEAELIDPASKFVLYHVQGRCNEELIRRLLGDDVSRLRNRHDLVLFTDGEASYATLFPEIFGRSYRPSRNRPLGRLPNLRYRIPCRLAHVQVIKHRRGKRIVDIKIRYTDGTKKRASQVLEHLTYTTPNTTAVERRSRTARRMNAHQVRKTLAFSRRADTKEAQGWRSVTVYSWSRLHRSLRQALTEPVGKNSTGNGRLLWLWD